MNIKFQMPTILRLGSGTVAHLAEEAQKLGKRALIVSDGLMKQTGHLDIITKSLEGISLEYAIYTDITAEPTQENVYGALDTYTSNKCDFVIAFGGGSCLDTAKAVAVLATNDTTIEAIGDKSVTDFNEGVPVIALPTTAGTGSEVTDVTVITNTKTDVKMMMKDVKFLPNIAIVDSDFTLTVPARVTSATGLDALCHALESYVSVKANGMTQMFSLQAIKKIMENLPKAYQDGSDSAAREQMSIASTEAGIAFSNASVTLIHGMSRPVGALFHVPHGISNAMLLNIFLDFSKDAILTDLAEIARFVYPEAQGKTDQAAAEMFIAAVNQICETLQIPDLKGYGIDEKEFLAVLDKMATDALASGSPQNNKKVPTHDEIKELYMAAFSAK
ncbi:iron-containing alcohol dehydrogenase [Enterococcus sp. 669A]|uniref:Iron-containing alcohol dehydrogenase n=1 Tax=Candidatus Enterococcus moelleringii TaxID=2815325 RepID=A0ABS3LBT3_9ENTE|nr:iron-containing alcohol dehydrogenase [Enterococcus sp. 669A]MBO1307088.1 iron-containing alcohol dehydrogenase [Enterococcus sp. 669A]